MRRLVAWVLGVAVLAAGCAGRVPGSILHPPANPALVRAPAPLSLAVELPRDERPLVEQQGMVPSTAAFVFLLFYVYSETRGNLVTGPIELGPAPLADLQRLTADYLRRAGLFRAVEAVGGVSTAPPADLALRARVHHLFASRYISTVFSLAAGKDGSDVHSAKAQHAPFGNAVVTYELVDRRGGKEAVVWSDTVAGFSGGQPADPQYRALPAMAGSAVASLLTRLARALQVATERLLAREQPGPSLQVTDGFRFLVHRTDLRREEIDVVTIEHPSGKVVESKRVLADGVPTGAPGEWLLSRRLPSGEAILGERYEAMARALAVRFDLRRVDDAYHYHFFGLRGAKAPPPLPPPPLPPPPTP